MVSLAGYDVRYRFKLVPIDEGVCKSDNRIYSNSPMVECIDNNILNFPQLKAACNYQDDMFLLVMKDLQQNLVCCTLIPYTMLLIKQILPSVTVFLYSRIVSYDF